MKPVIETFVSFLSYDELDVSHIDVYDDAWGFSHQFGDVFRRLSLANPEPSESVVGTLLTKIGNVTGND
jgi:hypothetical protein